MIYLCVSFKGRQNRFRCFPITEWFTPESSFVFLSRLLCTTHLLKFDFLEYDLMKLKTCRYTTSASLVDTVADCWWKVMRKKNLKTAFLWQGVTHFHQRSTRSTFPRILDTNPRAPTGLVCTFIEPLCEWASRLLPRWGWIVHRDVPFVSCVAVSSYMSTVILVLSDVFIVLSLIERSVACSNVSTLWWESYTFILPVRVITSSGCLVSSWVMMHDDGLFTGWSLIYENAEPDIILNETWS